MASNEVVFLIGYSWPEHEDKNIEYEERLQYAARLLLGARCPVGNVCSPVKPEAMAAFQEKHPQAYENLVAQAAANMGALGIHPPEPAPELAGDVTSEQSPRQLVDA